MINGWRLSEARQFGALMMGAYNPAGDFVYVGGVGTRFSARALTYLAGELRQRAQAQCPFRGPVGMPHDPQCWIVVRPASASRLRRSPPMEAAQR